MSSLTVNTTNFLCHGGKFHPEFFRFHQFHTVSHAEQPAKYASGIGKAGAEYQFSVFPLLKALQPALLNQPTLHICFADRCDGNQRRKCLVR